MLEAHDQMDQTMMNCANSNGHIETVKLLTDVPNLKGSFIYKWKLVVYIYKPAYILFYTNNLRQNYYKINKIICMMLKLIEILLHLYFNKLLFISLKRDINNTSEIISGKWIRFLVVQEIMLRLSPNRGISLIGNVEFTFL